MPREDPFAGIKLSEQASGQIEQRLFSPEPKRPPLIRQPAGPPAATLTPPGSLTAAKPEAPSGRAGELLSPLAKFARRFDLKEPPLHKASFLLTLEETEALEDLKLELRREYEYETKVTKNDLMRVALHLLTEDHLSKKEQSYVSRKLRDRWSAKKSSD